MEVVLAQHKWEADGVRCVLRLRVVVDAVEQRVSEIKTLLIQSRDASKDLREGRKDLT